jgi:hypothetical protein
MTRFFAILVLSLALTLIASIDRQISATLGTPSAKGYVAMLNDGKLFLGRFSANEKLAFSIHTVEKGELGFYNISTMLEEGQTQLWFEGSNRTIPTGIRFSLIPVLVLLMIAGAAIGMLRNRTNRDREGLAALPCARRSLQNAWI